MKTLRSNLLNRYESAELLGVSVRTLDSLVARGELPAVRIGKAVRFRLEELDRFVSAREGYGPAIPRKHQTAAS